MFDPRVRKIPWRRKWQPIPVFLDCLMAQLVKNLPAIRETWVSSLGWEDPLEKGKVTLPIPVFWPGEFLGMYSQWAPKELGMTERLN